MPEPYPLAKIERDAWVVEHRGTRAAGLNPRQPYAFHVEKERTAAGEIVDVGTIFLTNRECPWKCVMCDLWRHTLAESVPAGAIAAQIDHALERLAPVRQLKLYNAGSFFDARAIAPDDDTPIARRVAAFERVIVESHPALVGERCFRFRDLLRGDLEVAMGLETAEPAALAKLNKGVTLEAFAHAAERLRREGVSLRVFVLVGVPFVAAQAAVEWAVRSTAFAWECGATAVSLIATRGGNGAMEQLQAANAWQPPALCQVERAFAVSLERAAGRVFVDTWELAQAAQCGMCALERIARIEMMNLSQQVLPTVHCSACAGSS